MRFQHRQIRKLHFPRQRRSCRQATPARYGRRHAVQLRLQLLRTTYEAWVQGTACLAHSATEFIIAVPDENAKEWLALRLLPVIERTLVSIVGCMPAVRVRGA